MNNRRRGWFKKAVTEGSPLLTDLVAYFDFEDDVIDQVGTAGITLSLFSGAIRTSGGIIGNRILSNTSLPQLTLNDNDAFSFTDGTNDLPFSISLWINFSSLQSVGNWFLNKRNETDNLEYQFLFSNTNSFGLVANNIYFQKFNSNGTIVQSVRFLLTPSLNTWYHFVFTDDGSKTNSGMKLYVNGSENTSRNNSNTGTYTGMTNGNSPFVMMAPAWRPSNSALYHQGSMDEVGIWKNRVLTAPEVSELYNSGSGITYPF